MAKKSKSKGQPKPSYWASCDNPSCESHSLHLPLQEATGIEGKLYKFLLHRIHALKKAKASWPSPIAPISRPCTKPRCGGNIRITYDFPRANNPVILRAHYIGVTHPQDLDSVYYPMLWVTKQDGREDSLLDLKYVRDVPSKKSPWFGIGRPAVVRKDEMQSLLDQWVEQTQRLQA